MSRKELKRVLASEVDQWSQKEYDEVAHIDFKRPLIRTVRDGGRDYCVEVELVKRGENYLVVCVSTWEQGLSFYVPCAEAIVYDRD